MVMRVAELNIAVDARTDELERGLRRARGSVRRYSRQVSNDLRRVGQAARASAAAFTAAVAGATLVIGRQAIEIDRLSRSIGTTAESYQVLSAAFRQAGLDGDAVAAVINRTNEVVAEARDGNEGLVLSLARLGLTYSDLDQLSPEDRFETLAAALNRLPDATERSRIGLELFQGEYERGGALFTRVTESLNAARRNLEANGGLISNETIDNAARFGRTLGTLTTVVQARFFEAIQRGLPTAEELESVIRDAGNTAEFVGRQVARLTNFLRDNWRWITAVVVAWRGFRFAGAVAETTRAVVQLTAQLQTVLATQRALRAENAASAAAGVAGGAGGRGAGLFGRFASTAAGAFTGGALAANLARVGEALRNFGVHVRGLLSVRPALSVVARAVPVVARAIPLVGAVLTALTALFYAVRALFEGVATTVQRVRNAADSLQIGLLTLHIAFLDTLDFVLSLPGRLAAGARATVDAVVRGFRVVYDAVRFVLENPREVVAAAHEFGASVVGAVRDAFTDGFLAIGNFFTETVPSVFRELGELVQSGLRGIVRGVRRFFNRQASVDERERQRNSLFYGRRNLESIRGVAVQDARDALRVNPPSITQGARGADAGNIGPRDDGLEATSGEFVGPPRPLGRPGGNDNRYLDTLFEDFFAGVLNPQSAITASDNAELDKAFQDYFAAVVQSSVENMPEVQFDFDEFYGDLASGFANDLSSAFLSLDFDGLGESIANTFRNALQRQLNDLLENVFNRLFSFLPGFGGGGGGLPTAHDGGIIGGGSVGDETPRLLQVGEMVLTRQQQARLFELANGGGVAGGRGAGMTFNFSPQITGNVDRATIEAIRTQSREISGLLESEMRERGVFANG